MTIENNKKYQLSGEQLTDLAARLSILGSEAEEKAEKALSGPSAPTTSTSGQIGQLYVQDDGTIYILKDIIEESGDESGALAQFIWEEFGAGTEYTAGDGISILNAVISATNTGKAKVLTSADYNYPTNNPDGVALWLLDEGSYVVPNNVKAYRSATAGGNGDPDTYIIMEKGQTALWKNHSSANVAKVTFLDNGGRYTTYPILTKSNVVDNLTSSDTGAPLSAKQGKVLNDKIGDLTTLQTTAKTSTVAAINELADTVDDIEPQSGSGAPTSSTEGTIGQTYVDTSTGDIYYLSEIVEESGEPDSYVWNKITVGSGVVELTSADYNYPVDNPTSVALWLLDPGIYYKSKDLSYSNVKVSSVTALPAPLETIIVSGTTYSAYGSDYMTIIGVGIDATSSATTPRMKIYGVSTDGSSITTGSMLSGDNVTQSTGTSNNLIMSQNAVTNALASAGPTVVQTPGGSTSTVMSQATVTGMIFQDPLIRKQVQIATSSTASGDCGVGIGYTATSVGDGAIALGAGSRAMTQGEMNIGSNFTTDYGYNNSNYRLLTGLYDPQSAHDAATKGYVDTSITSAIGGITGFSYQVVSTLPVSGEKGVIYLVPTEESGDPQNIYEEYIWMIDEEDSGDTGRFELIGTTEIDLSDYVTDSDLQTTLSNYATTSDVNTAISGVEQEIGSLSGSGAPTSATEGTVGQTYVDSSTGDIYYLSEIIEESGQADTYVWKSFASGDTITPLTSADYNWNNTAGDSTTTPFDSIALWLLDPGIYTIAEEGIYIKGEISHRTSMRVGNTILITPPTSAGPYTIKGVFFTSGEGISHYSPTITTGSSFTHKGMVLYSDSIGYARMIDSELYNAASQSGGANDYCQIWRLPSGTYYGVFDTVLVQEYSQGPLIPSDDTIYIISDVSGGLSSRCIFKITTEGAYKLNFISGEYVSTEKLLTEGDISITMTNTDPGEGATVGENEYIAVYGGDPIILDYSLFEVNTGAKWIDGSAIYKKTINFGALPNATNKSLAHGISGLSYITKIEGMVKNATGIYLDLNAPGVTAGFIRTIVDSTNVTIATDTDRSGDTAYVTLYYTKSS